MKVRALMRLLCGAGLALAASAPALAQETTNFTYDVKGRVVTVQRTGGPSNGSTTQYTYDPADNRTNVTVTGSPNGSGGAGSGSGASATTRIYVVVPLNGLSLIVVNR